VIALFDRYTSHLRNSMNAGVLTTNLLYNKQLKRFWKSEVVGLMAADGTDWHDEFIEEFADYERGIIWNSGTPSGTTATIKALRNKIDEDGSFSLFYKRGDRVRYVAEVIDFATNDKELKSKAWDKDYEIYSYNADFAAYSDAKKSARIVFLTTGLKKLKPVPLNLFKFYKSYKSPTQHNLSPLEQVPVDIIQKNLINHTNSMNSAVNLILYGPPGTGKTYQTIDEAVKLIDPKFKPSGTTKEELRGSLRAHYRTLQESGHICFTTFHQSYTYEDFIEGIKPLPPMPNQPVQYDVLPGVFKSLVRSAVSAWEGKAQSGLPDFEKAFEALKADLVTEPDMKFATKTPGYPFTIRNITDTTIFPINSGGNTTTSLSIETLRSIYYGRQEPRQDGAGAYFPGVVERLKSYTSLTPNGMTAKDFVIIIDEINRGNISQIFGELITLIEPSKRLGEPEELTLILPYSKETFAVPPNIHIIGTMNTADRSVEALDTALRRRFSFKEMMPDLDQVEELLHVIDGLDFTAADLLKKLNQRIITLKDREHQIGHAYLIQVRTVTDLMLVFKDKIIPLLQEYFFGDYEKLQLVLGKGFVSKTGSSQDIFAKHDSETDIAYEDDDFYQLQSNAFTSEANFKTALIDLKVS
jgi:5-methylcytosine-specific restriction protein B